MDADNIHFLISIFPLKIQMKIKKFRRFVQIKKYIFCSQLNTKTSFDQVLP
jgi:hypothetical protein